MTFAVRRVLVEFLADPHGPHYGLEIARRTGIGSGSLYPVLARLEGNGLVSGEWESIDAAAEGRPPRRYYRLTASGREMAEEARQRLQADLRLLPGAQS